MSHTQDGVTVGVLWKTLLDISADLNTVRFQHSTLLEAICARVNKVAVAR